MKNQRTTKPRDWSPDAVTVVVDPASGAAVPESLSPKVALVEGSGPHLSCETQSLLRGRLRAAALILAFGFAVMLVWVLFTDWWRRDAEGGFVLAFHAVVMVVLGICGAGLCRRCPMSLVKLRVAELVIFGLPAAFLLAMQHYHIVGLARRLAVHQDPLLVPLDVWLILIFIYSLFIPNTWRRAAWVVGTLAAAPLLWLFVLRLRYDVVAQVVPVSQLIQAILLMLVSAVAAVYGTHIINTLRCEAFRARQLGQYRLCRRLGSGGMGEVYLAEHQLLKRPCAIKLIRPDIAADPKILARFEREVQATAKLSHWNTIEIYDYGRTEDGTFYYVMEYLPGLSLADLVERYGPLPPERVVHLLRQTCAGLREAHTAGLIHRDIKPGNIFAAQRGGVYDVAKLLDFGLVKPVVEGQALRLTQTGTITGSPLFMSPEQALGNAELDARSDIYSLGAVAYFLLTGRAPFEGGGLMAVLVAHARDEVLPPAQLRPEVPADLEQVVLRCLAKKPADRFRDADSLEQALAECEAADRWTPTDARRWWNESAQEVVVAAR